VVHDGERWSTTASSPVGHEIELGFSIEHADDTRCDGDGAGHDKAEQRGGATPASSPRKLGARGRQQQTPEGSSPPHAAPGRFLSVNRRRRCGSKMAAGARVGA
jgi:hypothetical protein